MQLEKLIPIIEACLSAAEQPITVNHLFDLFVGDLDQPTKDDIRKALEMLGDQCDTRGVELKHIASGFRLQVKQDYEPWVTRLKQLKPPKYSRALLETLSLVAYRQPVTRGDIESVRGVAVSSQIIKTLLEREWIKVLGHKDVPGKPSLYGTTRQFLDYFNLKSLNELPTLATLQNLDTFNPELALESTD